MAGASDSPEIEKITTKVLIIGSGPVGATFANILAKDYDVLMVEAGADEGGNGKHKKNAVRFQRDIDSFVHVIKGSLQPSSVPTDESVMPTLPPVCWSTPGKQIQNGQNPAQDPARNLGQNAVSRNVGGMSTHWTCATPRQHKTERCDLFTTKEWDGLYRKAEKLIGTHRDVLHDSIRQDMVIQILNDHFDFKKEELKTFQEDTIMKYDEATLGGAAQTEDPAAILAGDEESQKHRARALPLAAKRHNELITWSSSYTVLKDILGLTNKGGSRFKLRTECLCKKLTVENGKKGGRVAKATILSLLDQKQIEVTADVYIICGGPILTPQLLFNSGFRTERVEKKPTPDARPAGEETAEPGTAACLRLPALGHYLTEQIMSFCQVVLDRRWIRAVQGSLPTPIAGVRYDPSNVTASEARGYDPYPVGDERNKKWEIHREKWSGLIKQHFKDQDGRNPPDTLPFPFRTLDPQVTLPYSENQPWHTQIHRDAFSYGAVSPNIDKRTIVDLRFFGSVERQKRNCVTFTTKIRDAYGMPQPTFNFELSDQDRVQSHRMMKHMEEVAVVLGGYLPGSEPQFMGPGLALHVCGTTRVGRDNKDSCCDKYSKIHGVENLYVGGLNVIPTSNASNPTLTAMCFAIYAAEKICKDLEKTA